MYHHNTDTCTKDTLFKKLFITPGQIHLLLALTLKCGGTNQQ